MPKSKEFSLRLEDRPGMLGKVCKALSDRGVNIMAFQAFPAEGQSTLRMVVDDPAVAKSVLDAEHINYKETEVALAQLPNRVGELGRAASRLGEAKVNVDYVYCGARPGSNTPLVIFGVADAARAATLLDEVVAKAA